MTKMGPGKERGDGAWLTLDIADRKGIIAHLHECVQKKFFLNIGILCSNTEPKNEYKWGCSG